MPVITGRSRVATTYGIVAASQPLAAHAGVQMLERGGTAVDAAIAANAALGGTAPRAGERSRNPDPASRRQAIADDGIAAFYDGRTAAAIVQPSRERAGTLDRDDLREFHTEWVEPISTTYRGWTVHELPPNTQG